MNLKNNKNYESKLNNNIDDKIIRKKEENNSYEEKQSIVPKIIFITVFIIGLGIMLYPTISNLFNTTKHNGIIKKYAYEVENTENNYKTKMLEQAHDYNKKLNHYSIQDVFAIDEEKKDNEYENILKVTKDGLMGYIEIPKISIKLPIYHGTGNDALNRGVGHLQGSSLPIGGEGTHSILAAHRGLPSARLFTDLDKIEVGDKFYIQVLNERLIYEVDNVAVVLPSELSLLEIDNHNDYITLVTCTPYAVNTHRLLVRGKRVTEIAYDEPEEEIHVKHIMSTDTKVLIACLTVVGLMLIIVIIKYKKKK